MKKYASRFALALILQIVAFKILVAQTFTSSNLPIVVINTNGQTITDEPGIVTDLGIIHNAGGVRNNLTDPFNHYTGKAKVEYRGCSSQNFPKKSLGIELRNVNFPLLDSAVALFGFPAESDWVLNASYTDKTFLRDVLTYRLSNQMGQYASRTKHVEVVIDGQYMGLYVFQEKIKRDAGRIAVSKLEPNDVSTAKISGGYIVKIDKWCGNQSSHTWQSSHASAGSTNPHYFIADYPNDDNITTAQFNYIKTYVNTFETVMSGTGFANATTGYPKYIKDSTFIDYFLLQEISSNNDAWRFSTYMHKERDSKGGKLRMGAPWDFNLAWGFLNNTSGNNYEGWRYEAPGDPSFAVPFWVGKLLTDCKYALRTVSRFQNLRGSVLQMMPIGNFIDSMTVVLGEASNRNFVKWPTMNTMIWTDGAGSYVGGSVATEVNYLKTWISNRLVWMDANIAAVATNSQKIMPPNCATGLTDVSVLIKSTCVFAPSTSTNYRAGRAILLQPGFTANAGSVFKAEIKTCL